MDKYVIPSKRVPDDVVDSPVENESMKMIKEIADGLESGRFILKERSEKIESKNDRDPESL